MEAKRDLLCEINFSIILWKLSEKISKFVKCHMNNTKWLIWLHCKCLHSFFSIKVSLLLTSFYGNFPKQIFYKHYSHRFCLYRNCISRKKDCNLYLQCNENALIKLLMLLLYTICSEKVYVEWFFWWAEVKRSRGSRIF